MEELQGLSEEQSGGALVDGWYSGEAGKDLFGSNDTEERILSIVT